MTSYSDAKNYFQQLTQGTNCWKASLEVLYKWLKHSTSENPARQFGLSLQAKLLKSEGKVWEVLLVDDQLIALISTGSYWQLVNEHDAILFQYSMESNVAYASMIQIARRCHVFASDINNNVSYTLLDNSSSKELLSCHFRYEGPLRDGVKEIIPLYSTDRNSHSVEYIWVIYESKIIFLNVSISKSHMNSVVQYSVPPKSKLINVEGRDSIHYRNGLLALHYSLSSRDLQLQVLDSSPAILFYEKPHSDRRRTFETIKFPLTFDSVFHGSYRSGNNSEEILFSSVSAVVPDSCPDYGSTGDAISNIPFSMTCHILGSQSSISILSYKSSQFILKTTVMKLTGNQLLDFEVMSRNDRLLAIEPVQTLYQFNKQGHSHRRNLMETTGSEQKRFTLPEVCALLKLSIPVRRDWLLELWKDSEYNFLANHTQAVTHPGFDQIFLLEGVLGLGLSKCLEDAILKNEQDLDYYSKYSMEQSQKLYEWIMGKGVPEMKLPSLRAQLHSLLSPLLQDRIFPFLLSKDPLAMHRDYDGSETTIVPLTVRFDLSNLLQLALSNRLLTHALYERKLLAITETLKLGSTSMLLNTQLSDDLESLSLLELRALSYESTLFEQLVLLYHLLCQDGWFSLRGIFATTSSSSASAPFSVALQNIFKSSHWENEIPWEEYSGESLLFDLMNLLSSFPQISLIKDWIIRWAGNTQRQQAQGLEDQVLGMVFALPFVAMVHLEQKMLSDLLFYKRTLVEMGEFLEDQLSKVKYLQVYFLFLLRSLQTCPSSSGKITRSEEEFFEALAQAMEMDKEKIRILQALQIFDSCRDGDEEKEQEEGVEKSRLTWSIEILSQPSAVDFLTKYSLLEVIVKRLLLRGRFSASSRFLQALLNQNHPFMRLRKGIVAFSISMPSLITWELHWQQCRSLCDRLSPAESLVAIGQVTRIFCRWCLRVKTTSFCPLGSFLNKDFTYTESEEVIKFLFELANVDIEKKVAPSAPVDALFGLFLRLLRVEDARSLHETHAEATRQVATAEALQALENRSKLLQLTSLCPRMAPLDYQLVLNMNRINQMA